MRTAQQAHGVGGINGQFILVAVIPGEPAQSRQSTLSESNRRNAIGIGPVGQTKLGRASVVAIAQNVAVAIHSQPGFIHDLWTEAMQIADSAVSRALGI